MTPPDATLAALIEQRDQTVALVKQRQTAFNVRHTAPSGSDLIWLAVGHREVVALDAMIERLGGQIANLAIVGAGTHGHRLIPVTSASHPPADTDNYHHATLTTRGR